jgi:hypothetical protein
LKRIPDPSVKLILHTIKAGFLDFAQARPHELFEAPLCPHAHVFYAPNPETASELLGPFEFQRAQMRNTQLANILSLPTMSSKYIRNSGIYGFAW